MANEDVQSELERLRAENETLKKRTERTKKGAPVDALLAGNIEIMKLRVDMLISESRAMQLSERSAPMLEARGTELFEPVEPA